MSQLTIINRPSQEQAENKAMRYRNNINMNINNRKSKPKENMNAAIYVFTKSEMFSFCIVE